MHSSEYTHQPGGKPIIGVVMAAVLVWGGLLALGAFLRQGRPWPALITLGCVLAFLEGWLLLLWRRSARGPRRPPTLDPASPPSSDPAATPSAEADREPPRT